MRSDREGRITYASHASTRGKAWTSNFRIYYFGRTRLLFPYDESRGRYCDLLRDPVERATSTDPVVIASLQVHLSL
jgi:hypothetical protein